MKCNILPTDAEQAKIKEISYLQVQNTKSKMRWWFCWCGTSKSKRKCAICKCRTQKTKCNDRFTDAEQSRAKGNVLSASAEYRKQNVMVVLYVWNKQEQK